LVPGECTAMVGKGRRYRFLFFIRFHSLLGPLAVVASKKAGADGLTDAIWPAVDLFAAVLDG